MAKQVDVNKTLLDVYNDKELVNYLAKKLKKILMTNFAEGTSYEVRSAIMVDEIAENIFPLLSAVDKRMNGDSNEPNIVV